MKTDEKEIIIPENGVRFELKNRDGKILFFTYKI